MCIGSVIKKNLTIEVEGAIFNNLHVFRCNPRNLVKNDASRVSQALG